MSLIETILMAFLGNGQGRAAPVPKSDESPMAVIEHHHKSRRIASEMAEAEDQVRDEANEELFHANQAAKRSQAAHVAQPRPTSEPAFRDWLANHQAAPSSHSLHQSQAHHGQDMDL